MVGAGASVLRSDGRSSALLILRSTWLRPLANAQRNCVGLIVPNRMFDAVKHLAQLVAPGVVQHAKVGLFSSMQTTLSDWNWSAS